MSLNLKLLKPCFKKTSAQAVTDDLFIAVGAGNLRGAQDLELIFGPLDALRKVPGEEAWRLKDMTKVLKTLSPKPPSS